MSSLILRLAKGSPLTNAEVDGNFSALNADKIEADDTRTLTNKVIDSITNTVGADHIHFKVKATEAIAKGQVVRAVGFNAGDNAFEVALVTSAAHVAIGVSHDTLISGAFGAVINTGLLENFDTSAFAEGAILYPNTSGGFTATQPSSGTYQALAFVVRSHANHGAVLIEASDPAPVRTSSNVGNTVVLRDASGNFSAGTVTATSFAGSASGLTGLKTVNGNSILGSGNIQIDGGVTSFNTRTGAITLSSGDVTTALGFTPYNSTNPSGYITSSALSSYLPLSGGTLTGAIVVPGESRFYNGTYVDPDSGVGRAIKVGALGIAVLGGIKTDTLNSTGAITQNGNQVLHAGNYSSYALPLSGGTVSGNLGLGVSPDIRLSVDGEAHISSHLYMGGTAGSKNSWGSRDYTTSSSRYINANYFEVNNYGYGSTWSFAVDGSSSRYNGNVLLHAGNYSSYALPLSGGTVTGVANFRSNLGGYSGSLSSPPLQAYSDSNNSAFMSFHKGGYYAVNFGLDADNVLRIGGWSASANRWQLDMSGNGTYAGNVTAYSDESLKKDWAPVATDFVARLAGLKHGTYTRIDSGERQAGASAQDWHKLLPEVVNAGADGILSLAYGNAAVVSAIELAKRVVEQEERIERLEALVEKLIGD